MTWVDDFTWAEKSTTLGPTNLNKVNKGIRELKGVRHNAKDYGATGDGVADDTAAIVAAAAAAATAKDFVLLPAGTYKTSLAATALSGRLVGPGQARSVDTNKRAPWFSAISAAPSRGNWLSIDTSFNGDLSGVQIAMEHRVTGAATLGQPSTGYLMNQEASPVVLGLYNSSGWNQGTADGNGRTALSGFLVSAQHSGMGDLICFTGDVVVDGQKPGSTYFGANAAGGIINGEVFAGAAGVYLNPFELDATDQGFDAAGVGIVLNLIRSNNTGAKSAFWGGVRVQSGGTKPIDTAFMALDSSGTGGYLIGLDLANAGLATTGTWVNAAVTMKQDQRIYLNATGSDAGSGIYRRPSSTGNTWIAYDSGLGGINVVVGGVSAIQIGGQVTFPVNVSVAAGKVYQTNNVQVVSARQTGWGAPTGTLSRATFDQSTVTLPLLAQRVAALITDLTTHGLIGA